MKTQFILDLHSNSIYDLNNHAESATVHGDNSVEIIENVLINTNFDDEDLFVEFRLFGKDRRFQVADDNGSIVGKEIFIPEWDEVWEVPNYNYEQAIQNTRPHKGWETEGLKLEEIEMGDEVGGITEVKAYIYPLEKNDITIFDIISFMEDYSEEREMGEWY